MKRFIFATTANKDVDIEEYVRIKNIENIEKGMFEVYLSSWEDIVHLLEERKNTYNWYINNCQYKESSDIEVSFDGKKECEIEPAYIKTINEYVLKVDRPVNPSIEKILPNQIKMYDIISKPYRSYFNPPVKIDHTWCTISFLIKNIGSTVIEDYKIYIIFEPEKIEKLDDKFRYESGRWIDNSTRAQINASRESKREVFKSNDVSCVIEYIPKSNVLVQNDYKTFKVGVKPKKGVEMTIIKWVIKSRDYQKRGKLHLYVKEKIEEVINRFEVGNPYELKETEIIIEPKITEE